jgi:hypothetical protein
VKHGLYQVFGDEPIPIAVEYLAVHLHYWKDDRLNSKLAVIVVDKIIDFVQRGSANGHEVKFGRRRSTLTAR